MTRTTAPQPRGGGLLRTYLWLVLATTALTVVAALLAVGEQERTYTSTAEIVVNPEMTGGAPILPQMGTERATVESGDVAAAAAERLETDVETASEGLSVTVPVDTNVLAISYTAARFRGSPRRAQRRSPASTSTTATPTARRGWPR